jgi:malate/lactate dehydrogenase
MLNAFETNVPRRTAGWTSAFGTAIVVQAIQNDSKAALPCNAVLEGEYGLRNISLTVPVILGKNGIEEVQELQLTPEERQGLENSVRTLKAQMQEVENFLGVKTSTSGTA